MASLQHNLRTVGNYAEVQPAAGSTCIEAAAAQIALAARQHAGYLYDRVSPESLRVAMAKLPVAKAIGKAHKVPWAMRFLAASNNTGLTDAAKWCTCLLRAVQPELEAQWRGLWQAFPQQALRSAGISVDDPMPWFINNTAQLVCMVAAFSHSGMSQADFDAGGGFEALDVEKLYDMILSDDLLADMLAGVRTARHWYHEDQPEALQPPSLAGPAAAPMDVDLSGSLVVFADKCVPAVFVPGGSAAVCRLYGHPHPERNQGAGMWNDQLGKDQKKGKICVFSLATASALVELIVRTSFVHFGQTVYHQTRHPHGGEPWCVSGQFLLVSERVTVLYAVLSPISKIPTGFAEP